MSTKKYPALYQRIVQFYNLVADFNGCPNRERFIRVSVDSAYKNCCQLIRLGLRSEAQLIAEYPLY